MYTFVKKIFWSPCTVTDDNGDIMFTGSLSDSPEIDTPAEEIEIRSWQDGSRPRTSAVSYCYKEYWIDHFCKGEYEIIPADVHSSEDHPSFPSLKEALSHIDKYLYEKAEAAAAERRAKEEKEALWESILDMLQ